MIERKNVLGEPLQSCCKFPMTGFMRDGYCRLYADDPGQHTVCFEVSEEFLKFSVAVGNDLSTGIPEMDFPGLIPGDRWWSVRAALGRGLPRRCGAQDPLIRHGRKSPRICPDGDPAKLRFG